MEVLVKFQPFLISILLFEFPADDGAKGVVQGLVLDLAEDFLEEAEDEQLLRLRGLDAAGFEVEFLFPVDAGAGGTVGAAYIVGLDLETGQRVWRTVIACDPHGRACSTAHFAAVSAAPELVFAGTADADC